MRDIPARQFGLFTVVIKDYIEGCERLFQTFSDAFDYISKSAKGAEIFEVESDSFRVVYTFVSRKTNGHIKFATATIHAHLFTYDENKPLITHDYMWTYDENNGKTGHLQQVRNLYADTLWKA